MTGATATEARCSYPRNTDTTEITVRPMVVIRRCYDGQKGSLHFQHSPRCYFGFEPYQP
jgi:hypothetical protein